MNPLFILAGVGAVAWWASRKVTDAKDAAVASVAGQTEGTVIDLGSDSLPSNTVPISERTASPDQPGVFVIPRMVEILEPKDGAVVAREGLLGKTYPVTIRWTNALAMAWTEELIATVQEDGKPPRELRLGRWVIGAGENRTAVIQIGFGGGVFNIGTTLVQLRIRFGAYPSVASYYVD